MSKLPPDNAPTEREALIAKYYLALCSDGSMPKGVAIVSGESIMEFVMRDLTSAMNKAQVLKKWRKENEL